MAAEETCYFDDKKPLISDTICIFLESTRL